MKMSCKGFAEVRWIRIWLGLGAIGVSWEVCGDFQGATHLMPFEEETINYNKSEPVGPIARLQSKIESGEVKLGFDSEKGYLPALLEALGVSVSSQLLVFSKTSFQRERISPRQPRALFFNDEVYVGWIPGSPLLEVSMADPKMGGVFYTLEQKAAVQPRLKRTDQCLECHASSKSLGVPGHLVRSFVTDEEGVVDLGRGTSPVTHRTPLAERWGGWYVTGQHGDQSHLGNLVGSAAHERHEREPLAEGNLTDLSRYFDGKRYPRGGSDIVALMVLEHQTHMHNLLTRVGYEATIALKRYGHLNYLKQATDALVRYLLFVEEAPLTAAIEGEGGYRQWFEGQGRRDSRGRSLRQFNLRSRLFEYPCSYLIYSEAFEGLAGPMKSRIYERLWEILSGEDTSGGYERLTPELRRSILEILMETKPGLAESWKGRRGK